jgi:hypothetical protein
MFAEAGARLQVNDGNKLPLNSENVMYFTICVRKAASFCRFMVAFYLFSAAELQ